MLSRLFVIALVIVAHYVFDATTVFAQSMPGRANGKIAFTRTQNGNSDIYTINPHGTDFQQLTFEPGFDDYAAWSADGTKIAYLSQTPSGQYVIKKMNSIGGEKQIVAQISFDLSTRNFCGERFSLSWSPSGDKIAFQEFGHIVSVNVDGTNRQNITNSAIRESEPTWALTGLLAYASTLSSGDDVNGLDVRTTEGLRYANYGYFTCSTSPALSPDGTRLAYVHSNDYPPPGYITIIPVNSPGFGERVFFDSVRVMSIRWSPDGNLLALTSNQYPNPNNVEIIDQFGQGRRTLTQGSNPSWQPIVLSCPNPIDCAEFFIQQQYQDFLGREPDPQGFAGWLNILTNCGVTVPEPCDRIEVSSAFFRSPEFQGRGYFIYRFYPTIGKVPIYSEFRPDLDWVSGFLTDEQLETAKASFAADFMARSEFQTRYASTFSNPTAYVDALLQTVGLPGHPGRAGWINTLNGANNAQTRAQVLRQLVESAPVYDKYYNEAFVIMQYFGYLRRTADAAYLTWIQTMNQKGGDYRIMINGFVNSLEYRRRFGP